jgi:GNAT superfamily N-acetyltransferase
MLAVDGFRVQAAAVLHDALEDTELTAEELGAAGLPIDVVDAVVALTHRPGQSYDRYVEQVASDAIAREVKLADLADNLANNKRLPNAPDVMTRIERYERAIRRLRARDTAPAVAPDDSIRLRRATIADAESLVGGFIEGVADYPSFAPPGWTAPSFDAELKHLRGALADPEVCCLIAESEGALVGQITILPAARAPHPVADPSLAHISNLFVRRDHWGAGLATDLHRAALEVATARGVRELRLFVAAGQARARRFYEREGWLPEGDPFDDPVPGLTMIEYRYRLGNAR